MAPLGLSCLYFSLIRFTWRTSEASEEVLLSYANPLHIFYSGWRGAFRQPELVHSKKSFAYIKDLLLYVQSYFWHILFITVSKLEAVACACGMNLAGNMASIMGHLVQGSLGCLVFAGVPYPLRRPGVQKVSLYPMGSFSAAATYRDNALFLDVPAWMKFNSNICHLSPASRNGSGTSASGRTT